MLRATIDRNFVYPCKYELDIEKDAGEVSKYFIGTHDFSLFRKLEVF